MRFHSYPVVLLAALPSLAIAVSLSDFTPRVSNLSSGCDKVYHQTISGCQGSDFASSSGCSTSCVNALMDFVTNVKYACSSVQGSNIVTAFVSGIGPSQLCPNAPTSSSSVSKTSSSSSSSSTTSSSSSSTTASSSMTSTTSSVATDTSSSPVPSSTSGSAPTQTHNPDQGGSPFDVSGNAASSSSSASILATFMSLTLGVVFLGVR